MFIKTNKSIKSFATKIAGWVGTPMSIVIHTILFIAIFVLHLFGVNFSTIMLVLTTVVSLEAIYLSLFIQMTVNQHSESLEDVKQDVDIIQEDVEDIGEDIGDVQENVESLETNVKEIQEDVEDIVEVDEPQKKRKNRKNDYSNEENINKTLQHIVSDLVVLSEDIKHVKLVLKDMKKGR
jgi:biopolymer transport protein ExbB/TolQ